MIVKIISSSFLLSVSRCSLSSSPMSSRSLYGWFFGADLLKTDYLFVLTFWIVNYKSDASFLLSRAFLIDKDLLRSLNLNS